MTEHMIRSFDEELRRLKYLVEEMGKFTQGQLVAIVEAMEHADATLAERVIQREPEADHQEHAIDDLVVRLLALKHPVAIDLRETLACLRIANELERICDHAENAAERLIGSLREDQHVKVRALAPLADFASLMVNDAMEAFSATDGAKAQDVWNRDQRLDEMYSNLFRNLLTSMIEDPRHITATVQVLFIARDIERIGDRATNIAEMARYFADATPVPEQRPKADTTASIATPAAPGAA
ncbi:MAG TPA: phosphate signaling complex protein PhoU [Candidatus Cybelea sp.]|nr:phosphate signaling complex protein PhoU [Candidatus Cybelea sp.]